MKKICILGSTGSIGKQTLEVCSELNIEVTGLAAHSNTALLARQTKQFHPKAICLFDGKKADELKRELNNINIAEDEMPKLLYGLDGLCKLAASDADNIGEESELVLNAVVGGVGLRPTLAAIDAKKTIALANKETLVTGGKLVIERAKKNGVSILPVDSEHSAIFQSLRGNENNRIKKIILTASGGPFYGKATKELENVTVEQALNHPNWSMGQKITIDSATMMNKGLELIEACWLFNMSPNDVEIVIHRESVVHSLVEYEDNAVIAQLGIPDMKLPIQYALTYPDRLPCNTGRLSLTDYKSLTFAKPDEEVFICLKACIEAAKRGGLYPALINGANEEAVSRFLKGKISFLDIGRLVYGSLTLHYDLDEFDETDIELADRLGREYVISNSD